MTSADSAQQVPDRASDGSLDDPDGRADQRRDPVTGRAAHSTGERQAAENEDRDLPG